MESITPKAATVSEISNRIEKAIATDFAGIKILVQGEISNFKNNASGHLYFTLKDEKSVIKAIMFRGYTSRLNFRPQDGMKVVVIATVAVYKGGGYYQLQVEAMKQAGQGDLNAKLEELKAKLSKEGLFAESHKQEIPKFSKTIGVVTSKTGSVIRDIITVSTRRNPNIVIKLVPVAVQGTGAASEIAEAIRYMNTRDDIDVLIVGRGGGSLEDLWPFNEEIVVRAIYDSKLPVISAVGHETDWTLSDFVADKRAATPSAAAEIAVASVMEIKETLIQRQIMLTKGVENKIHLNRLIVQNMEHRLKDPSQIMAEQRMKIDRMLDIIENNLNNKINIEKMKVEKYKDRLEAYNVENTLDRGYTLIMKDGKYVSKSDEIKKGDNIVIRFKNDKKKAEVLD